MTTHLLSLTLLKTPRNMGNTQLGVSRILATCMTLTQNVKPETYLCLTEQNIKDIQAYIEAPMTATTFKKIEKRGGKREIVTAELIYYWMIAFNIPVEFQKWHLNKLLTLIEVCARKNEPPKKMSRSEISAQHRAINAANKARFHTKG